MTIRNEGSETQCVFSRANWSQNHFALLTHPNSIVILQFRRHQRTKIMCFMCVCDVDTLNKGLANGKVILTPVRSREKTQSVSTSSFARQSNQVVVAHSGETVIACNHFLVSFLELCKRITPTEAKNLIDASQGGKDIDRFNLEIQNFLKKWSKTEPVIQEVSDRNHFFGASWGLTPRKFHALLRRSLPA